MSMDDNPLSGLMNEAERSMGSEMYAARVESEKEQINATKHNVKVALEQWEVEKVRREAMEKREQEAHEAAMNYEAALHVAALARMAQMDGYRLVAVVAMIPFYVLAIIYVCFLIF